MNVFALRIAGVLAALLGVTGVPRVGATERLVLRDQELSYELRLIRIHQEKGTPALREDLRHEIADMGSP